MIPTPFRQFRTTRISAMRPSSYLMNAAGGKKKASKLSIPVELTPLFLAMGIAVASAIFFTGKKFLGDESLRVGRKNPNQSNLHKVLNQDSESKE